MTTTSVPKPAPRRGRWRAIGALGTTGVVDNFENGLISTLFPAIRSSLGLSLSALGVLTAISRLARMIFGPLWSAAADRFGRKRVLVLVTGVWGLWTAATGLAQDFWQLLILYSIAAIGTVAGEPIMNGMVPGLFEERLRGRAYGVLRTINFGGVVVVTPLIGLLSTTPDGWRWGMLLCGLLSVTSGILVLLFVEDPEGPPVFGRRRGRRDPEAGPAASQAPAHAAAKAAPALDWKALGNLLRIPTIRFMTLQVILVTSPITTNFFITFFVDERGWTNAEAALLFAVFMLGSVASGLIGGHLGDVLENRYGPRGRVAFGQGYLLAYGLITLAVFQLDWGGGAALIAGLAVFGIFGALGHPGASLPIIGNVVPKAVTATAFGLVFSLVQGGSLALFSVIFGVVGERLDLEVSMLWLVSIPYLVNAVLWTVLYRLYPRDLARNQQDPGTPEAEEARAHA